MGIYSINKYITESITSDVNEANSTLIKLYSHLLKFQYQPNRQGTSWIKTIKIQREHLENLCKNTNVRNRVSDIDNLSIYYKKGLDEAYNETSIDIEKIIGNNNIPQELSFVKIINKTYITSYMLKYAKDDNVKNQVLVGVIK